MPLESSSNKAPGHAASAEAGHTRHGGRSSLSRQGPLDHDTRAARPQKKGAAANDALQGHRPPRPPRPAAPHVSGAGGEGPGEDERGAQKILLDRVAWQDVDLRTWTSGRLQDVNFRTWTSGRGLQDVDFRTWTSGRGLQDVDFRTWTSGRGLQDVDFRTWTSGRGLQDVDFRTWTSGRGLQDIDFRTSPSGQQDLAPTAAGLKLSAKVKTRSRLWSRLAQDSGQDSLKTLVKTRSRLSILEF
ncbi:unnamed protein product [Mortierella alpina]